MREEVVTSHGPPGVITPISVAIIGATGACGRQLAVQLLDREMMHVDSTLQLVGHHGGAGEHEMHGIRADLRDAFADGAPRIELIEDAAAITADIVVMLAGTTLSTDPRSNPDRVALA